jgi:hypothetical protein
VCFDILNVVEVGLPVLDHAIVVTRDEPVFAVRPLHGTNSRLMSRHDSLKVEARAIPQCELSTSRSGKKSPAFWCPSYNIDRVLDFVERRV